MLDGRKDTVPLKLHKTIYTVYRDVNQIYQISFLVEIVSLKLKIPSSFVPFY